MNPDWKLENSPPAPNVAFVTEHVIVEYDGAQVVTVRDQYNDRFLGVAADDSDDGSVIRWIYSSISDLEFCALMSGGLTVRDALIKDVVYVIDHELSSAEVLQTWRISGTSMPNGVLPTHDSLLPPSVRARFIESERSAPEIRVAGRHVSGHEIAFTDLGAIAKLIQRLWDAICVAVYFEKRPLNVSEKGLPSTLFATATVPGSFGIRVRPTDEVVFERIAREYGIILQHSYDENSLRHTIETYNSPDLAPAYAEYLAYLELRQMEVLAQGRKSSAFIGPYKAGAARGWLPQKKPKRASSNADSTTRTFVTNGYFEGYSYVSRRFDLFDLNAKAMYSGDVEEGVLTGTPIERGLVLSSASVYSAEVRETRRGDKPTYTLLGFWRPSAA